MSKTIQEWNHLQNTRLTSGLTSAGLILGAWVCGLTSTVCPPGFDLLVASGSIPMLMGASALQKQKEATEKRLGIWQEIEEETFAERIRLNISRAGSEAELSLPQGEGVTLQYAREIMIYLDQVNVPSKFQKAYEGSAFVRVQLKITKNGLVNKVKRLGEELQQNLGYSKPPIIQTMAGGMFFDVPKDPDERTFHHFLDYIKPGMEVNPKLAIGINIQGELIEFDLSDPVTCHLLIGGQTGGGKSMLLRCMILSLMARSSPDHIQIALGDPKRVEFIDFQDSPFLWKNPEGHGSAIAYDESETLALLNDLLEEMERRYQLFAASGVKELASYNLDHPRLPRIVFFCDEFADLMLDKDSKKLLEDPMRRLGAKARAAGIHLVLATQRPSQEVCTPILRANLVVQIALRVNRAANSSVILGVKNAGAEQLMGNGDMLVRWGADLERLQALYCETEEVFELINSPVNVIADNQDQITDSPPGVDMIKGLNQLLEKSANLHQLSLTADEKRVLQKCKKLGKAVVKVADFRSLRGLTKEKLIPIFKSLESKGFGRYSADSRGTPCFYPPVE